MRFLKKKQKIHSVCAVCLGFLLYSLSAFGQVRQTAGNLASPNISNLGLFGEVPVSLFTGTPQISIPLHEITHAGAAVPIQLLYHASGFRPDMHPGWVGLGWSLAAGGYVTRIVKDLPDDYSFPGIRYQAGFYWKGPQYLSLSNWDFLQSISTAARANVGLNAYGTGQVGNLIDTEPDEFNFSLPGLSGSFYFDAATSTWLVKCDKPVQVKLLSNGFMDSPFHLPSANGQGLHAATFCGFSIRTGDGTKYTFGGVPEAVEYDIPLFSNGNISRLEGSAYSFWDQNSGVWTATTWQLTEIVSPDGEVVNFSYETDDLICSIYRTYAYRAFNENFHISGGSTIYSQGGGYVGGQYAGQLIRPVYLKSITTSLTSAIFFRSTSTEIRYTTVPFDSYMNVWESAMNGTFCNCTPYPYLQEGYYIDGNPDLPVGYPSCLDKLQWKQLDSIQISVLGERRRSFNFTYSQSTQQRLTLLGLQERGIKGTKPSYVFSYNISSNGYGNLPNYLAAQPDHWGFNTGRPFSASGGGSQYQQHQPTTDSTIARLGLLRRIQYPTGGATEFRFEQHVYRAVVDTNRTSVVPVTVDQIAGGVRIKRVSTFGNNGILSQKKTYFYSNQLPFTPGTRSTGILASSSKYGYVFSGSAEIKHNGIKAYYNYEDKIVSNQSTLPASENSMGCHIGYTKVIELLANNSYNEYTFSNFDNGHLDEPAVLSVTVYDGSGPSSSATLPELGSPYNPCSPLPEERGKLILVENFSQNHTLVQQKTILYQAVSPQRLYARALRTSGRLNVVGTPFSFADGHPYKNYIYSYFPIGEQTKVYDSGPNPGTTPVQFAKNISYTNQKQISSISTSDGRSTYTTYPDSYASVAPGSTGDSLAYVLQQMREAYQVTYPVEEYQKVNNNVVAAQLHCYRAGLAGNPRPHLYRTYQLQTAVPLTNYQQFSLGNGQPGHRVQDSRLYPYQTVINRDLAGNEITTVSEGQVLETTLWGYAGTLPIAKVQNATGKQVSHTDFEPLSTGGWSFDLNETSSTRHLQPGGRTGLKAYVLNAGYGVSRSDIPSGEYELSFWAKEENAQSSLTDVVLYGASAVITPAWQQIGPPEAEGWRLCKYHFSFTSASINLLRIDVGSSTKRIRIDGVRLHPVTARLTTYTHDPLFGMTSATDANHVVTLYEYDAFGRLQGVRDRNGDLRKGVEYKFKGTE